MRAFLWLSSLFLVACGRQGIKSDLPVTAGGIVEVPVEVYVPIDPSLTAKCSWRAEAPLEVMPSVARERKKCLEFYEANIGAISNAQGKPVPTPAIRPKR